VHEPLDQVRVVRPNRARRARAARRRRRTRVAGTTVAVAIAIAAGAVIATRSGPAYGASAEGADTTTSTSTTTSSTVTTTTAPPNDLLAPPPTVLPELDSSGGLAPQVRRVDTTDRVIFITIDDGQVRDPSYLDHFAELGVPFTSFVTQPMAEADPAFWNGTVERGGSLQTHTIRHPDLHTTNESTARREICGPAEEFTTLFGERPTLFRPPYGNSNETVRAIAGKCGYHAVVLWTGSTNNGKLTMQNVQLQPGDIILMHYRDTLNADLDDVVARARAEGFRIARLEDYLVQP
jgi:peptidoglycan/xylan/chitin deacetylase (PgdA/CDA1 family)